MFVVYAQVRKRYIDWLSRSKADHICMQETRALEEQIDNDNFILKGYTRYMNIAVKKGYSGVAIYSNINLQKYYTFLSLFLKRGRFISLEFGKYIITSIYFPLDHLRRKAENEINSWIYSKICQKRNKKEKNANSLWRLQHSTYKR